ncbi:nucleoside/nucleotide kinase family protein [Nakamurella multipartita]|uniref:nucleoside/nucleotide kinase family protein n=1 Tax=Nakamurella multipartita TaxID=53461 RepID=UPI00019E9695|nr:nucleoside/nucleotide kinase family protein [Nakamurella multipartita]
MSGDGLHELADRAQALVPADGRAILGIVGAPGSGKSTLADQLLAHLRRRCGDEWVAHVPMDGFHLADAQLRRLGSLDRKGAPDTFDADGYAHLLARIKAAPDEWIYVPGFERDLEQPIAAALVVPPAARLIITEGNYLLLDTPSWRAAWAAVDEVWSVLTEPAVRQQRLVARHIHFGKDPDVAREWVLTVDEPNAVLIDQGTDRADLFVHNAADGWRVAARR